MDQTTPTHLPRFASLPIAQLSTFPLSLTLTRSNTLAPFFLAYLASSLLIVSLRQIGVVAETSERKLCHDQPNTESGSRNLQLAVRLQSRLMETR